MCILWVSKCNVYPGHSIIWKFQHIVQSDIKSLYYQHIKFCMTMSHNFIYKMITIILHSSWLLPGKFLQYSSWQPIIGATPELVHLASYSQNIYGATSQKEWLATCKPQLTHRPNSKGLASTPAHFASHDKLCHEWILSEQLCKFSAGVFANVSEAP